ncbi:hypothetical protein JW977_01315 [Candidatus Falkowbacteria bacterium]|nr:hypothetical protein [Candidatus Falkowbacteria bacterium]
MARKRLPLYGKKGPKEQEARELAINVFDLQERLAISNEQMATEIGWKKTQVSAIKSDWVNRKEPHGYMYASIANGLIQFWNNHLIVKNDKVGESQALKPVAAKKRGKKRDEELFLMEVLIKKVGFAKARALLEGKGKVVKYHDYIMTLSPEEIAELL